MHFYTSQGVSALIAGLFLLSQGAAAAPASDAGDLGTLTCADPTYNSDYPTIADCEKAIAMVKPFNTKFCINKWIPEFDAATYGTCTVHTYSTTRGKAHCLSGMLIIKGGNAIIASCPNYGFTGGQYQWTTDGSKGEGVRLIKSKA